MKTKTFSLILGLIAFTAIAAFATHALTSPVPHSSDSKESSGGGLHFHHDYESALAVANTESKPLILIFSASWCPPCQQMKNSVYPSNQVAPYHNDFIWTYLDADAPANRSLMHRHRVSGIPHIAFEDASGAPLGKLVGGVSPDYFAEVLSEVKEKSEKEPPATAAPVKQEKKKPFRFFSRNEPFI